MKKRIIILCFLLFFVNSVNATGADVSSIFEKGNQFYAKQQYEKASKEYLSLIDEHHLCGSNVYYNLANSYYQQGLIGKAILYYEKALILRPRDKDIKFNLEIVNKKVIDKTDYKVSFVNMLFGKVIGFISIGEISVLLWIVLVLTLIGTLVYVNFRYHEKVSALYLYVCLPILMCTLILFSFKYYSYEKDFRGVVLVDKQDVRSGPGESFTVLFSVHEGLKFKVIKQISSGWMRIGLPNGLNGWVPKSNVGIINPL